jgi:hypothetical protein
MPEACPMSQRFGSGFGHAGSTSNRGGFVGASGRTVLTVINAAAAYVTRARTDTASSNAAIGRSRRLIGGC